MTKLKEIAALIEGMRDSDEHDTARKVLERLRDPGQSAVAKGATAYLTFFEIGESVKYPPLLAAYRAILDAIIEEHDA